MNKSITKYIIINKINNSFWTRTVHYGFTAYNKQVMDARFTDDLLDANFMSETQAKEQLKAFLSLEIEYLNILDPNLLTLTPVNVTYSIPLIEVK